MTLDFNGVAFLLHLPPLLLLLADHLINVVLHSLVNRHLPASFEWNKRGRFVLKSAVSEQCLVAVVDKLEVILFAQVKRAVVQSDRRAQIGLTLPYRVHTLSHIIAIRDVSKIDLGELVFVS